MAHRIDRTERPWSRLPRFRSDRPHITMLAIQATSPAQLAMDFRRIRDTPDSDLDDPDVDDLNAPEKRAPVCTLSPLPHTISFTWPPNHASLYLFQPLAMHSATPQTAMGNMNLAVEAVQIVSQT